jgi:membrane fusion protein (multidrug efflux system)
MKKKVSDLTKRQKMIYGIGAAAVLIAIYVVISHIMYVTTDNAQVEAHTVMLASKVSGFVKTVNALEGQKVKQGDILAEIDDRDYQNALKQYEGELSSLEAKKNDAEKNYKRMAELYRKEVISSQQYDQVKAIMNEVKSKYESLEAQVSQAQLNLENTKILAPSDGFIAKKAIEIGQLASPGVPLYGFVDATERWVTANFKETDIEGIKVGAKVDIDIDAIKSKTFEGKVLSLSAATGATFTLLPPDNATGNFTKVIQRVPVKILIENVTPEDIENLRVGLSAFVKVHKH